MSCVSFLLKLAFGGVCLLAGVVGALITLALVGAGSTDSASGRSGDGV